jgi:tetratricopeptide (TPR) repeat protein
MLRKAIIALLCSIWFAAIPALAKSSHATFQGDLQGAEELFDRIEYGASLSRLDLHSTEPAALFLIGRDYYMLADFKKATSYLKKAVAAAPGSSEYADWLGRAYTKRADTSNPLHAVELNLKARKAFERAVQLNARNVEALSDLFEYYLNTPPLLGGGYSKAENVAEKMSSVDVSEALLERAELAGKRDLQNQARKQVANSAFFESRR